MFYKECKKIFVKQRAVIFLLIILLIKILLVCMNGYDSHYMIDENEKYYLEYIEKYQGKITKERITAIEEEYNRITHETNSNLMQYQKENAFQVVYHQYIYQKDKGGGYILDTRGWQTILEHDNIDYLLIIGIIIFSTMLFAVEYDTDMHNLLLTSSKGKYHVTFTKLLIGAATSIFLSAAFQMIQYIYLYVTVGLPFAGYPLQCLEYFEKSNWNCTLGQVCLFVFIIRIFGGIFTAFLSFISINVMKKISLSMISSIAIIIIIDVFCGQKAVAYYLPIGLLKGTGYFWADQYITDIDESGDLIRKCLFQAVSPQNFLICMTVFLILIIILYAVNFLLFSNLFYHFKIHNSKKLYPMMGIFLVVMMLNGCANTVTDSFHIEVGESYQDEYITDQYQLNIDEENSNIMYCPKDGETIELLRNVFPRKAPIKKIFVQDNLCYYLMENDLDSGVCIRCIDLNTFSDTYIYSNMDENTEDFYGLVSDEKSIQEIFSNTVDTNWFFVVNDCIFLSKKNYIKKIDIHTNKQEIVADLVSDGKVIFDNNILYYNDANGESTSVNIQ